MTPKYSMKAAAIELLRSGLATAAEVAWLADVSRQAVAQWAEKEGFDPVETREAWLEKAWTQIMRTQRKRG